MLLSSQRQQHSDAFSKGGGSKTSLDMLIFGLSYTPPISVHEVDTDSESIADSYSGSEKVTSHLLSPKSKVGRPLGSRNKTTSSTVVRKVKVSFSHRISLQISLFCAFTHVNATGHYY